ncbi:MAG: hypothetical protein JWN04_1687 [Myxococcaceae bacterium]|nr:hypothetical protein [Myxococcaceae bacterium]
MMRTRDRLWCVAALLVGCTFSTHANDRKAVDKLDFNFTLQGFKPHAGTQVDVALVTPSDPTAAIPGPSAEDPGTTQYTVHGRIRVLMPPDPNATASAAGVDQPYPDVKVQLSHFLDDEYLEGHPLQVLFYADTNNDFLVEPLDATKQRLEHTWVRGMPVNGELSFSHAANFQNFYDDEIQGNAGDLVLDIPDLSAHPAQAACLVAELGKIMNTSLEVRLIFNPDEHTSSQVAAFKMHAGNALPSRPIKFKGLSDVKSMYAIQPVLDGLPADAVMSEAASTSGLIIPFEQWFPVDAAARTGCLALL